MDVPAPANLSLLEGAVIKMITDSLYKKPQTSDDAKKVAHNIQGIFLTILLKDLPIAEQKEIMLLHYGHTKIVDEVKSNKWC
jgi:hypothetical protein